MDNGIRETQSTNGILMEDEIMETPAVSPVQPTVAQGQAQQSVVPPVQPSQPTVAQGQAQPSAVPPVPPSQPTVTQGQAQRPAVPPVQPAVSQGQMQQSVVPPVQPQQPAVSQGQMQQSAVRPVQPTVSQGQPQPSAVPPVQPSQSTATQGQAQQSVVPPVQPSQSTVSQGQVQQSAVPPVQLSQSTVSQGQVQQSAVPPVQPSQSTVSPVIQSQQQIIQPDETQKISSSQSDSVSEWKRAEATTSHDFSTRHGEYSPNSYSDQMAEDKTDVVRQFAGKPSNLLLGLVGALLANLLLSFYVYASYFYMKGGVIAPVGLFVITIGAYAYLGKGLDAKGIISCILLTSVSIWIANQAAWTHWCIEQIEKALGTKVDFWEMYPRVRDFLREVDYMNKYYQLTLRTIGIYLLTVIGIVIEAVVVSRRNRSRRNW